MDKELIMIMITSNSEKEAKIIIKNLLKNRLIACGNLIGPIFSSFWWEGEIENSIEYLVLLKSRKDLFKKIEQEILKFNSYEIPEIIVFPIIEGSKAYLDWINKCLNKFNKL